MAMFGFKSEMISFKMTRKLYTHVRWRKSAVKWLSHFNVRPYLMWVLRLNVKPLIMNCLKLIAVRANKRKHPTRYALGCYGR